jgi:hypothetical protein
VTYSTLTTGFCTVTSGGVITLLHAGDCTIDANQAGNGTYNPAPQVSRTFTIAAGNQTITFGALAAKTLAQSPVTIGATASSGLTVSFASNSLSVCTVSGTSVALLSVGTCSITAAQTGNADWNAASPTVTQTFGVSMASGGGGGGGGGGVLRTQTITFTLPASGPAGATVALTGSASSGLALTYTSTTTGVCTVSGSTLSLLTAGMCSVTASQPGDGVTWAAAAPVSASMTVTMTVIPPTVPALTDAIVAGVNRGTAGFTTSSVILAKPGYVTFLVRLDKSLAGKIVEIWTRSKTGAWKPTTSRYVAADGTIHYFAKISAWTGFVAKNAGGSSHGRIGTVK